MTSATAPRPLRLLLAWPDPPARDVRRALRSLGPGLEVDYVAPVDASQHLVGTLYYHILLLSTEEWRDLPLSDRQRYAHRAALLVLGPEPAFPSDLTGVSTAVYFSLPVVPAGVTTCLLNLCGCLSQGWPLGRSVGESSGRLSFLGSEACWPETEARSTPGAEPAQAAPRMGNIGGSVVIGDMHVGGDYVGGNKVVNQAAGDQSIQGDMKAAKIVQQAGRDQVNINRLDGESGIDIHQTADGDQVNINSHTNAGGRSEAKCPECGSVVEPGSKFCGRCGLRL